MEIIYLLIPLSLIFIAIIGGVLFWAIKSGQYDDLEKEGHRILMEEDGEQDETSREC
jgi:cbb3-type cytochrome oxidase maturation protein